MTSLNPVELLQTLVRIDTTNPPGNEIQCISYLNDVLKQRGLETNIVAKTDTRPNLIARLPGRGESPPVLWQAHVDVVTTKGQDWKHPPFSGDIVDGYLWGRGTLDDKGHAAMMVAAIVSALEQNIVPPGDLIFAALADEEANGIYGAKFLVEEHPELFEDVHYAIGEGGGFSITMGSKKFYPIMVAEKQICTMRLTIQGKSGHGSVPRSGQAMAKLGQILRILDRKSLPVHITPVMQEMIETVAQTQSPLAGLLLRLLLNPAMTDKVLKFLGEKGATIGASLHNTATPTIVHGGDKFNVLPSEIALGLDGRLLPGQKPEDMVRELKALLKKMHADEELGIEVLNYEPGPQTADMEHYNILADLVRANDPSGVPCPYLVTGVTDARLFGKLGIQSYGFAPVQITDDLLGTVHGANERIPVSSIAWGTEVMLKVLQQFHG